MTSSVKGYPGQQPWPVRWSYLVFQDLWTLGGAPPESCPPSLTTQPCLGQINGTAGSWVFNWAFLMGGGGRGGLMRPGPVFILTFRAGLYRCPSSDLKGRYGLVGLPQRCQTSPSSSAEYDIFSRMEYTQHIPSVATTHRAQCSHHHMASCGKMNRMFCDGGVGDEHAICPRWLNLLFSIGNKAQTKQLSGTGQKLGLPRSTVRSQKYFLFKRNVPNDNSRLLE